LYACISSAYTIPRKMGKGRNDSIGA